MEVVLRLEEEHDYPIVEELTREAFWNVYCPGCNEHLLIHNLRNKKEFIKNLDFVAIHNKDNNNKDNNNKDNNNKDNNNNNKIVGNIVYCKAKIIDSNKEYSVLTFGPLSVSPKYQNKGIGTKLINHTLKLSKKMGYKAIIIYGDPEYYKRFGFKHSKEYKITNKDKKYPVPLLVLELYPNALNGIKGIFEEGKNYEVDENELIEFEKGFSKKEKKITKTQERFNELIKMFL